MTRLRVLLIAEAANPEWTSVPLEGWSHAMALREIVEGHLVTQVRNRDAIVRAGLREHIDFTAIDSESLARPMWRLTSVLRRGDEGAWTTLQALAPISYFYFEYLVWKQFGQRIRAHEFDVVHRLTPLSPTTPSPLAKKCAKAGVPFVIGPLNGGVPWPTWFQQERRSEKEWLAPVRMAYKLVPAYGSTLKHSAAIIAGSYDTMRQLPKRFAHKTVYVPENAVDPSRFMGRRDRQSQLPLKLLFVGRLVPYKGADMAIEAAEPLLTDGRAQLTIVGDGPQRQQLEELACHCPRRDSIRFVGRVPHTDVQQHFSQADVLLFPSIREFGGAVVLEAMLMGAVPIVVNYGGPGELVTDEVGFRVPLGPREQIVAHVRMLLQTLVSDLTLVSQMAARGPDYVRAKFTWARKAHDVLDIYTSVIQSNN